MDINLQALIRQEWRWLSQLLETIKVRDNHPWAHHSQASNNKDKGEKIAWVNLERDITITIHQRLERAKVRRKTIKINDIMIFDFRIHS